MQDRTVEVQVLVQVRVGGRATVAVVNVVEEVRDGAEAARPRACHRLTLETEEH